LNGGLKREAGKKHGGGYQNRFHRAAKLTGFARFATACPLAKFAGNRFLICVQGLEPSDIHRLNAALGWLGLNAPADARAELDAIAPEQQSHPAVLEARWMICAHEKNWPAALAVAERELVLASDDSSGWLHRAYAVRRVAGGGLAQAWAALLPAAEKFPDEPVIPYNLACYACQLDDLDAARVWLKRAVKIGGKEAIRKMALEDDDLKPLWPEIAQF
jgi:tetratricopeptide (TPR) repeat protein